MPLRIPVGIETDAWKTVLSRKKHENTQMLKEMAQAHTKIIKVQGVHAMMCMTLMRAHM